MGIIMPYGLNMPRPRPPRPPRPAFIPGTLVRLALTRIFRPWISVSESAMAFGTASASRNSTYANPLGLSYLSVRIVTRLTVPHAAKCFWSSSGVVA